MRYRSDIDGLRAIAVVSVVLFHAEVPPFSGGYVGVDIFFVISGFLITSIVAAEIEGNRFSLLYFYERRIRRIFPAFFVLLASVAILGYLLFLPAQLENLGRSIVASTLFVSNILYWRDTGYFSTPIELRPLLHTWSLGIEEQFYVIFPALLAILFRWVKTKLSYVVAVAAVVSLAVSIFSMGQHPQANFYFLGTRAWELLSGASLALLPLPAIESRALQNTLSFIGLLLISWAVVTFSNITPFPGANALFPCLGAALIIYSGMHSESLIGRALSLKPIVFIGLISYSLYLWHWPLIVFAKYYAVRPLSSTETALVVAASLVIATMSWHWVEKPFRIPFEGGTRQFHDWIGRKNVYRAAFSSISISVAIGLGLVTGDGLPWRLSPEAQALAYESTDIGNYRKNCLNGLTDADLSAGRICKIGVLGENPSFLLWGDSQSAALADGLDSQAKRNDQAGLMVGVHGCPPLLGIFGWYQPTEEKCETTNNIIPRVIKRYNIRTVILHAAWSKLEPTYAHQLYLSGNFGSDEARVFDVALENTLEMLRALHVRKIYVVTSIPGALNDVPSTLARSKLTGQTIDIRISHDDFKERERFSSELFSRYRAKYDVNFIRPDLVLCDTDKCQVEKDGHALYFDNGHLSQYGSKAISPILQPIFENHQVNSMASK